VNRRTVRASDPEEEWLLSAVSVGVASLAVDDDGDGPVVVLVHAGIADRRMWAPVARGLVEAGLRVIRYDLRGYGESSLPGEPFSHHDDLAGLLAALDVPRATLAGCSFGGRVAIDAALAHPDLVNGLVLIGSVYSGCTWSDEFRAAWDACAGDIDDDDLESLAAAEVRFWVVGPRRGAGDVDPDLLRFAQEMDRGALAAETALDSLDVRQLDPPAAGRLHEIGVPALVLTGAGDVPDIHRLADELTAGIPQAQRASSIAVAAHLVPLERPHEVAAAILSVVSPA
jgi:3-oxoadipate enol-lactonase